MTFFSNKVYFFRDFDKFDLSISNTKIIYKLIKMCSILKNLSYLFFYLYFVNAFTVGFANQNAMESILQRIRSADRLQPGFQDPIRRIVELHQSQTNLEEKETEESNEETNNVNKEKLNKELQRIEDLKKTVLEKLKLSSPPNISTTEKIPINSPVMRALFKQYGIDRSRIVNDDDDDDEIKSQKLVSTAKSRKLLFYFIEIKINK